MPRQRDFPPRHPPVQRCIHRFRQNVRHGILLHVYTTVRSGPHAVAVNTNTSLKWLSVSGVIAALRAAFSPAAPSSSQTPAAFAARHREPLGSSISTVIVLSRMSTPVNAFAFHADKMNFTCRAERSHALRMISLIPLLCTINPFCQFFGVLSAENHYSLISATFSVISPLCNHFRTKKLLLPNLISSNIFALRPSKLT